jgi:membrane protease subunit (stomatin/prohibitin family)
MGLMDFIKKQFIDVIHWTEDDGNTLAWRFPMQDMEIQNGASLTVRESQLALFIDEGVAADTFGPGRYRLSTQTLPLLTNLRHWDKLFESPFKSDVYFFNTRQQLDCKWGTPQAISIRDKEFGAVRVRAFGNYAFHVQDAARFHKQVAGTRERCSLEDVDGQLRALVLQGMSHVFATGDVPFLDLAANQVAFAAALRKHAAPAFAALGLALDDVTVQNVSLPDELQKVLDQKIGMGMVGQNMAQLTQYQAAQALTTTGSAAGDAMGLGAGMGAGVAMGQVLGQVMGQNPGGSAGTATVQPADVLQTIERLGELKAKGLLSEEEFSAKKAELLKKLV